MKMTGAMIATLLAVVFAWTTVLAAGRGIKVDLRASERPSAPVTEAIQLYESSHALVIGNDKYAAGWPLLSNAVSDARAVATELGRRGFDVTLKTNLKSFELKRALEEFFIIAGDNPKARLFVWFAGHGHTLDGEGFIVPVDAPRPEVGTQFRLKALSLRRFGEYVRLARAKHAYVVFDSCFAGTVFDGRRALPPAAVTRATALPVRQFLTSGDIGQTVSDDGMFRSLFLRALTGDERADANGDGYLTASEMGLFLSSRVTNLTQSRQTPRYGKLRDAAYDRGDFVFVLPGAANQTLPAAPAPATPGSDDSALEITFWTSVKDSDNPSALQAYLARYPNGVFAQLARLRVSDLEARAQPKPVPPKVDPGEARWQRIKDETVAEPLENFLKANPNSAYAALARGRLDMLRRKKEEAEIAARKERVSRVLGDWSGFVPSCGRTTGGFERSLEFKLTIDTANVFGTIWEQSGSFSRDMMNGAGRIDTDLGLDFYNSDYSFIIKATYNTATDRFTGNVRNIEGTLDCEIELSRD